MCVLSEGDSGAEDKEMRLVRLKLIQPHWGAYPTPAHAFILRGTEDRQATVPFMRFVSS